MSPGRVSVDDPRIIMVVKEGKHTGSIPSSSGVWQQASYINHSCNPNCARVFIGDMVIIRAAKDLPAGTELTAAYFFTEDDHTFDQVRRTMASWDFICACDLCAARQRLQLLADSGQSTIVSNISRICSQAHWLPATTLLPLCGQIDEQYAAYSGDSRAPCLPMSWLWPLRSNAIQTLERGPVAMVDAAAATLRGLGFDIVHDRQHFEIKQWGIMRPGLPSMLAEVHDVYARAYPAICPAIKKYVRLASLAMTGEDETFAQSFPKLAD